MDMHKGSEMTEADVELAGQFVIESMGSFDYYPYTDFYHDILTQKIQRQYQHYCLMAKSNLAMSFTGHTHPIIAALKNRIKSYVSNSANSSNKAMRYLYEETEKKILIQQLSMGRFKYQMQLDYFAAKLEKRVVMVF